MKEENREETPPPEVSGDGSSGAPLEKKQRTHE